MYSRVANSGDVVSFDLTATTRRVEEAPAAELVDLVNHSSRNTTSAPSSMAWPQHPHAPAGSVDGAFTTSAPDGTTPTSISSSVGRSTSWPDLAVPQHPCQHAAKLSLRLMQWVLRRTHHDCRDSLCCWYCSRKQPCSTERTSATDSNGLNAAVMQVPSLNTATTSATSWRSFFCRLSYSRRALCTHPRVKTRRRGVGMSHSHTPPCDVR